MQDKLEHVACMKETKRNATQRNRSAGRGVADDSAGMITDDAGSRQSSFADLPSPSFLPSCPFHVSTRRTDRGGEGGREGGEATGRTALLCPALPWMYVDALLFSLLDS